MYVSTILIGETGLHGNQHFVPYLAHLFFFIFLLMNTTITTTTITTSIRITATSRMIMDVPLLCEGTVGLKRREIYVQLAEEGTFNPLEPLTLCSGNINTTYIARYDCTIVTRNQPAVEPHFSYCHTTVPEHGIYYRFLFTQRTKSSNFNYIIFIHSKNIQLHTMHSEGRAALTTDIHID